MDALLTRAVDELPGIAFDERHEELHSNVRARSDKYIYGDDYKDLHDYKLTESARQVIADSEKLSDGEFSEFLQYAISNFPNPVEPDRILHTIIYAPDNFYMRRILCTVAVEAALRRKNFSEDDREKLLSGLTQVRGYELDISVSDDGVQMEDRDKNIEHLIMQLGKLVE